MRNIFFALVIAFIYSSVIAPSSAFARGQIAEAYCQRGYRLFGYWLNCDGDWGFCPDWRGWQYDGHENGQDHYICG